MIIWALFDSENSCYEKAASEDIEIYSIGVGKGKEHIECDLSNDKCFELLDTLPIPDLIIASPPCESWSVASGMQGGNACWKHTKGTRFIIRELEDYAKYQYNHEKQLLRRINGELCTLTLIKIIKRYEPKVYVIENPATSKMWEYIERVLGFEIPYHNDTTYSNYEEGLRKPTKFKSNINLNLRNENIKGTLDFQRDVKNYSDRSNIPLSLIKDIYIML